MSEIKRLSMLEILNETIQFYGEDTSRRGVSNSSLSQYQYQTDDGRNCAVGRCFTDEVKQSSVILELNCKGLVQNISELDSFLQEQYKGHEIEFWTWLQNLHDTKRNWNPLYGLTEIGKIKVKELKEKFGLIE